MKFKILPKIDGFRDASGTKHKPGEIVDLPESYEGESWLQKILTLDEDGVGDLPKSKKKGTKSLRKMVE